MRCVEPFAQAKTPTKDSEPGAANRHQPKPWLISVASKGMTTIT